MLKKKCGEIFWSAARFEMKYSRKLVYDEIFVSDLKLNAENQAFNFKSETRIFGHHWMINCQKLNTKIVKVWSNNSFQGPKSSNFFKVPKFAIRSADRSRWSSSAPCGNLYSVGLASVEEKFKKFSGEMLYARKNLSIWTDIGRFLSFWGKHLGKYPG